MARKYRFGKKLYRDKTLEDMMRELKEAIERGVRKRRKKGNRKNEA